MFAECGFDGMTRRRRRRGAGVGKGTIYRRYPGKLDLIIVASQYFGRSRAGRHTGTTQATSAR